MKIPLHNCNGKMLAMEEGTIFTEANRVSRIQRITYHFKVFKWFIIVKILILLIFCSYALWSLYVLKSAIRTREGSVSVEQFLDIYDLENSKNTSPEKDLNETFVIPDFNKWRESILRSLENLQESGEDDHEDVSYNLKFLLHTLTSVVRSFVDSDKLRTEQRPANSSIVVNTLFAANLTDFEIHILREFMRLKGLEKSRIPRTLKSVQDESACDLQFSFAAKNDKSIRIVVKPVNKGEGTVNIGNHLNDLWVTKSDTRACSFIISYEPK